MNHTSFQAALPAIALFAAATLPAQEPSPLKKLIDTAAPAIVTVEVVAEIDIPMMGGSQEMEQSGTGVIVDASGMILVDSGLLDPGSRLGMMFGGPDGEGPEIDVEISSIKVVIGNEAKALDASIVAKDSKLGFTYLQLADIGDRKLPVQSFIAASKPTIGQEVFTIARHGESFDYAPYYLRGAVIGKIKKPRRAWTISGGFAPGTPVFHKNGELAGVACAIQGEEGGGGMMAMMAGGGTNPGVFLINAKNCANSVLQALEQAKKAAAEKKTEGNDK